MKITKRYLLTLALACTGVLASWAQDEYVTVNPTANANEWTLQMPAADVELEIEYEPNYYVVGTMNSWAVDANYQLQPNTQNEGEYYIHNVILTSGQGIKVVSSTDGSNVKDWYPSGDGSNYVISEDATYSIYFLVLVLF